MDAHGAATVSSAPPWRVEVSYCVVNTEQRELLLRCLDAIAAEQRDARLRHRGARARQRLGRRLGRSGAPPPGDDRGRSRSSSAAARARTTPRCCSARAGATACCSTRTPSCCPARPRRCATRSTPTRDAGAAGALLLRPDGRQQPSAWRFPTPLTALVGALFLHRRYTVQSRGDAARTVDWAQSAALLVRRDAAEQIGWFDPAFFVYSDEVDFCKRLRDAGWRTLYVPQAAAIHHEQLSTGAVPERRIVELSRNRDRYMRKHHTRAGGLGRAAADRVDLRAARRSPRSCCPATTRAATGATSPRRCAPRGEGLREAASEHNRGRRL